MSLSSEFLILIAFSVPAFAGSLTLTCLLPRVGGLRYVGGIVIGHAFISLAMFVASLFGISIWLGAWLGLAALAAVPILLHAAKYKASEFRLYVKCPEMAHSTTGMWGFAQQAVTVVVVLSLAMVVVSLAKQGLGEAIWTYPEIGVWGLKAKSIYIEDGVSAEFFSDPSRLNTHPGYPLSWPLTVAWCYLWIGHIDDVAIRLLPLLAAVAAIGSLIACAGIRAPWGLAAAVALIWASGRNFVEAGNQLYADFWMMAAAIPGVVLAAEAVDMVDSRDRAKHLTLSGAFLGAAGWIKQDGLLVSGIVVLAVILVRKRAEWRAKGLFADLAALLFPILLIAGPWQYYRVWHLLPARDFPNGLVIDWPTIYPRLRVASERLLRVLFLSPTSNGWAAYLLLAVAAGCGPRPSLCRRQFFLFATALAIVALYIGAIAASSIPINWHLVALPRIIFLPSALVAILAADMACTWWRMRQNEQTATKRNSIAEQLI